MKWQTSAKLDDNTKTLATYTTPHRTTLAQKSPLDKKGKILKRAAALERPELLLSENCPAHFQSLKRNIYPPSRLKGLGKQRMLKRIFRAASDVCDRAIGGQGVV